MNNLTSFQRTQANLLLADLGYQVLIIEDQTFVVDSFEPSDTVTFKHTEFKGCQVDSLVEKNVHLLTGQVQQTLISSNKGKYDTLTQELDTIVRRTFKYHGDIHWKLITK